MVRISSEWRFIPQSVVLTERAFEELSVLRKCSEYKIVRYDDELRLERSGKTIQMKQDDVSVYGKILQLTSVQRLCVPNNRSNHRGTLLIPYQKKIRWL